MFHCFGNLLTLFSHVGHVCCGHFVSCVLIWPASQSSLSESSYWICLEFNTFLSKLVSMGSDGESVMLGKKSGVLALLKEQQPSLIGIHCSAHRLELCYKDAMKKVPMAEKVLTLLTGLYYMYRNSPLNRTNLKNAYKCLSINIKLPTRAGGTRWVRHILRALEHFLDGYPAF